MLQEYDNPKTYVLKYHHENQVLSPKMHYDLSRELIAARNWMATCNVEPLSAEGIYEGFVWSIGRKMGSAMRNGTVYLMVEFVPNE